MPNLREIGIGLLVAGLSGFVVGYFVCPLAGLLAAAGLGVALILIDAVWRRWQRPKRIARHLDQACLYIIRTRWAVEAMARLNQDMVLGPFEPPPPGSEGRYGPFSNADARSGYERLRDLGIIERESFDTETATTRYRWTKLGEAIAARL